MAAVEANLDAADVIVLSDYAKGVLCDGVLDAILAARPQAGRLVIADPKRPDFAAYRGATILTPNEHEVRVATRIEADHDTEADRAGRVALEADRRRGRAGHPLGQGPDPGAPRPGALCICRPARGKSRMCPAPATRWSPHWRSRSVPAPHCRRPRCWPMPPPGYRSASRAPPRYRARNCWTRCIWTNWWRPTAKSPAWRRRVEQVAEWRRRGLKVGFANGCFDLIHPGHVRLLSEARAACDRLIVALNTDASVKRLKGPTRPLQNEMARATVMASMAPVDLVTLFDEDTPLETDPGPAAGRAGERVGLHRRSGGRRRPGAGLGRQGACWSRCGRAIALPARSGG